MVRKGGSAGVLVLLASTAAGHNGAFVFPLLPRPSCCLNPAVMATSHTVASMGLHASSEKRMTNVPAVRSNFFQSSWQLPWSFSCRKQGVVRARSSVVSAAKSRNRDPDEELVDIVERAMLCDCKIEPGDTLILAVR
jgi:hypothetical protein